MPENNHYNILLVEDHAPNVVVASSMIDLHGYSYLLAANGVEAVEKFKADRFDLVLMDIRMPLLSGVETTKQIREIEKELKLPHTPIIAMTAYIASSDMNACVEAGMDDIIPKPFHPEYFSTMLKKYCKKSA